ncbi:tRNA pseudouridine(38-40) synthase TruA [Aquisalimonas asiatica]|uniref:tRNA pseudouridine synthase A n=1 Tax=Aquisalimonas asiatica TaxID=406100 RepID=A0A1H8RNZ7_9GAMM|nr:tRNA pseudouridine(38-40) synthase TruA [Aquisalimonas asiatica]SEO68017.1 tRNA pseudouridine38-40 synthase [Aquisalimonas asiatica]
MTESVHASNGTSSMRIAMGVEYLGGRYAGWQQQHHCDSVQARVEAALSRVADHPVQVVCAGRTDAGVHGLGQVIHFDTPARRNMHGWRLGGTTYLPDDIALTWAQPVAPMFDARRSALQRHYRYVILNRPVRPAWLHGQVAWTWKPLDAQRMHAGAQHLLGERDFTSFRAVACQAAHAWREVTRVDVARDGDFIYLDVSANAFLHHMVRNIAGTLMTVGAGERPPDWVAEVLSARDRTVGGMTAPAAGLYMVAVDYPEAFRLPAPPAPPRFA